MIGNDVIDCRLLPESTPRRSRRFWNKVLTADEQPLASNARQRWALWAAKESAFKVEARRGVAKRFCPKRYRVVQLKRAPDRLLGQIDGQLASYPLDVLLLPDCLLARCWEADLAPPAWCLRRREAGQPPSLAVRQLLQEVVTTHLPEPHSWQIQAPYRGIPSLVRPNYSHRLPVSLSHHGAYIAVAWPSQISL